MFSSRALRLRAFCRKDRKGTQNEGHHYYVFDPSFLKIAGGDPGEPHSIAFAKPLPNAGRIPGESPAAAWADPAINPA
jgi:hypothetical protein